MKLNGFDSLAGVYDALARMVFGKSIVQAQKTFLSEIRPGASVLILGGGTGWIASELLLTQPDCTITYVDASRLMLAKSRQRLGLSNRVHFIHGTEEDISVHSNYDVVITNFYFDMFPQEETERLVKQIMKYVRTEANWLVADFCSKEQWWQRLMLWVMYRFFQFTAGVEASMLPDLNSAMQQSGWIKKTSKRFYGGFIESAVFVLRAT